MRIFVVGNYMNANFLHVPHLPHTGESVAATGVFREHGGKGLNLAVALHRLGADVALKMAIGRDEAGASVVRALRAMNMNVSGVVETDEPSGFGVGFIAADGGNFLSAYLGANLLLDESHIFAAAADVERADWILGQFEAPEPAIAAAFRLGRAAGARTYLNPSPWREPDAALFAACDALVMNESESARFFDSPALENASLDVWRQALRDHARARSWQGEWLVATLAARGAIARDRAGKIHYAPGFAIDQMDATGAGDAFGAGFVWALQSGRQDPLAFANACGALVARRIGILEWLPGAGEVEAFLRQARAVTSA
ncbi:MAG: hypothetical protein KGL46_03165 [Hyphomicrobiales bacterium]|nr:hypothetical protein [Hyphomicrobiales bacterium]